MKSKTFAAFLCGIALIAVSIIFATIAGSTTNLGAALISGALSFFSVGGAIGLIAHGFIRYFGMSERY